MTSGKEDAAGRPRPLMVRILREPTVQFSLVAGLLFGVAWVSGSGGRTVIEIDGNEVEWRVLQVELAQGAPLSLEARQQVEDTYVEQQILAHEARAMGLEADERIDELLAQKMLHVLSGDVIQPSDADLVAYYEANRMRYAPEATVAVDEVVLPAAAIPGGDASAGAERSDGAGPPGELLDQEASLDELVGDILLSHRVMPSLTRDDLTQLFSAEIAGRVMEADPGEWVGPHVTIRGRHWLRVNDRTDDEPLPLEAVRERVRLDWIADQEAARLADRVAELEDRYEIRIVDGGGEP